MLETGDSSDKWLESDGVLMRRLADLNDVNNLGEQMRVENEEKQGEAEGDGSSAAAAHVQVQIQRDSTEEKMSQGRDMTSD